MIEPIDVPQSVIDAFHLMWDEFPEPAQLHHKSKQILAVNKASAAIGMQPGMVCSKLGSPESHKGCLAARCLKEGRAQHVCASMGGREIIGFWQPVAGYPELYVHYNVGFAFDYKKGERVLNPLQRLS